MDTRERMNDILNFLDNFKFNSLLNYKQLIIEFNDFSDCMSEFEEQEINIILSAFNDTFEKIREILQDENNNNDDDSFTLEDFIDEENQKTYFAYKINKHFNDLKKETKILIPLRLLLPENRYCYPNLELEDFKIERENR